MIEDVKLAVQVGEVVAVEMRIDGDYYFVDMNQDAMPGLRCGPLDPSLERVKPEDWKPEKSADDELERLTSFLHSRTMHPDYEYETTTGPRKNFDVYAPEGDDWERNTDMGREGWERFYYHEEAYWRRKKETILQVGAK